MNQAQLRAYNEIKKQYKYVVSASFHELPGTVNIQVRVNNELYLVFDNGRWTNHAKPDMCKVCIHTFERKPK